MTRTITGSVLLFLALAATACGSSSHGNNPPAGSGRPDLAWGWSNATPTPPIPGSTPTILSNVPLDGAVSVDLEAPLTATFSEAMDPISLDASSFTLTYGLAATPVLGTVSYSGTTARFQPTALLASNGSFTATVTAGARSAGGVHMALKQSWTFATGNPSALPVNLGTAGGFVILAKSAVSTVPASAVTGNIGCSPAAASFITGFSLVADATNVYSTSAQVTGMIYAADYAPPTPSNLTTAVGDMQLAFTDAAGRAPDAIELGAGDISGMTLAPGVYKWGTGLLISSDITLTGDATDVFIFQIAQDLTVANAVNITLAGGALPKNIFWQVSGQVNVGTTAHFEGVILSQTAITFATGSSINGRMLAQTAVAIDSSTVVEPAP